MNTVAFCYTPYGHERLGDRLLGFNGYARLLENTYSLGNGHRMLGPALMRFLSPDALSPFDQGGLNCYAYCGGDPINRSDPTGQFFSKFFGRSSQPKPAYLPNHYPKILKKEIALVENYKASAGKDPRRVVTRASDVSEAGVGVEQKYVLTKDNQLIVASSGAKNSPTYISHPSLAERVGSKKVISAGTFRVGSLGEVFVYNRSGHYRPEFASLAGAVEKFRSLGFEPTAVNYTP